LASEAIGMAEALALDGRDATRAAPQSDPELAPRLLAVLRAHTGIAGLRYASPPERFGSGVEARVFGFRLVGASGALARPLVLRLFDPEDDPGRAPSEAAVQNEVAGRGFPAPRVLLASDDPSALGGGFLVMERLPGEPMMRFELPASQWPYLLARMPPVMARLAADLHALAPGLAERSGSGAAAIAPDFASRLASLRAGVERAELEELGPAVSWLERNRPATPAADLVLCHGDLWPGNVLLDGARVSGVIDWSWQGLCLAPPEYDVAILRVGLACARVALPPPLGAIAARLQVGLAARFLRAYERRRSLDRDRLLYFELYRCVQVHYWVGTHLQGLAGTLRASPNAGPWDLPDSTEGFAAHFEHHTGVALSLPSETRPRRR
jgi:aminoglycoside phosphotransferase (APT) family kinase protein